MQDDPFHLERFLAAQRDTYAAVQAELRSGRKVSHWMWFIFPQIAGLGRSPTSERFAISGLDEARAFLAHPVLGARLRECANQVNKLEGKTARQIFGTPDDLKLRSSMTLFSVADPGEEAFLRTLAKYFDGEPDPLTIALLGRGQA